MQSEKLTNFYRAYNAWLENGAPEGEIFTRHEGLCGNLYHFTGDGWLGVSDEMRNQFSKEHLSCLLPFEKYCAYYVESDTGSCHLNELRIEWVKAHLEEEE